MLLKSLVLLCSVVSCLSKREIGGACSIPNNFTDMAGTCQPISNCAYARKVLYEDERKPTMCWWDGEKMIVCCPLGKPWHTTGRFGKLFDPRSEGIKRSRSTICRYDGERNYCCPIVRNQQLPEGKDCPALKKPAALPTLSPGQRIAWNKCVENLRYVDQCIAKNGDRYRPIRHYECGIKDRPFRIAGGRDAESKEFPHMVVLGVAEDPEGNSTFAGEWVGGGALVSDRFVLTAGHVLIDPSGRPLRYALMGSLNKKDVRNGLLHIIVNKIPHPLYHYPDKVHDIALLELDRPVTLSSFVRPICLPVPGQDTEYTRQFLIAGWGITSADSDKTTDLLQTAQVSLLDDYQECQDKFGVNNFQFNSSTMLCAKGRVRLVKGTNVWMDSCHGDSGGPLMAVLSNVNCSYRAEGVVSFGPRCAEGSAAVYTRVEHYLNWIVKNVWPEEWRLSGATD